MEGNIYVRAFHAQIVVLAAINKYEVNIGRFNVVESTIFSIGNIDLIDLA